jgi:hypothetical protein
MYLIPQNCTLKMVTMIKFMLYTFYHNKNYVEVKLAKLILENNF